MSTRTRAVAQDELFGPVLVVLPHDGDEDAVRVANNSIYGLSGSVMSADRDRALAVARAIRAGTMSVNGGLWYAPDAPFGGYKQSGMGREMGAAGLDEFLERKTFAEPAWCRLDRRRLLVLAITKFFVASSQLKK